MQNQMLSLRKNEEPQHDRYEITGLAPENHFQRVYKPENYMTSSNSSGRFPLGDNFVCTKIKHLRKDTQSSIYQIKAAFEAKIRELTKIIAGQSQQKRMDLRTYSNEGMDLSYRKKKIEEGEARKQALIIVFKEKTEKEVERCEMALNMHWKSKINGLQELLRVKESIIAETPDESMEEIRRFHEISMKQSLQQYETKISYELNENYRAKYIENIEGLTFKRKSRHIENMNKLIKDIESSQYEILRKEKALFIKKYEESHTERKSFSTDLDFSDLHAEEIKLRDQARNEIKEIIEEVSIDIEKALQSKFKSINQENFEVFLKDIEKLHSVWTEEAQQEPKYRAIQEQIVKKQAEFVCRITDDISVRVATEVSLKKNQIYEEVSLDFLASHEEFRKKLEEKSRKTYENIEIAFTENFFKKINYLSEKKLRPVEVKIKMTYHKRLDNSREMITKEIEKRFLAEYKVSST